MGLSHQATTSLRCQRPYNGGMDEEKFLDEYFEICKRIYEQMERDGTWPWKDDSTNSKDSVDSDSNQSDP